jgi:hypothetical protein
MGGYFVNLNTPKNATTRCTRVNSRFCEIYYFAQFFPYVFSLSFNSFEHFSLDARNLYTFSIFTF